MLSVGELTLFHGELWPPMSTILSTVN